MSIHTKSLAKRQFYTIHTVPQNTHATPKNPSEKYKSRSPVTQNPPSRDSHIHFHLIKKATSRPSPSASALMFLGSRTSVRTPLLKNMFFSILPQNIRSNAWHIHRELLYLPRWRHTPLPRAQKMRGFFCTPQRAGIQRVTSVSREIPENFSKFSSPKIWSVCQNSVPLHSQIRNEAHDASQI